MSILDVDALPEQMDINVLRSMMQKEMIISRVIHPVGQGAFYTERIKTDGKTYNVVYDCGSTTAYKVNRGKPILEAEIKTFYDKNENIDLLFISHFDYDHVNGLKYLKDHCNIKRVIIPLIPTAAQWIYLSQLDDDLQLLMTNPEAFFGVTTKISKVRYTNGEDVSRGDDLYLNDEEGANIPAIISSGTKIKFRSFSDWCYIPFNFDEDARYKKLIDLIASRRLDLDKLLNGDVDYIIANRAKINEAYKNVVKKNGSSNESSLIVYSGPTCSQHSFRRKRNFKFGYYGTIPRLSLKNVACLYLGDMNLNQACKSGDLCVNLRLSLDNVIENIGLIQVPHHGSKKSFNDDILFIFKDICVYFASFSKQNRYGHPSYKVVEDIEMHNHFVGVTEDRNSALVETIIRR